ncbi:DUF6541 family protein [Pseudonocardia phyllosphaerae]|uniref:DUF6541 family protein n=1 Tax=Pseudonocardia phyllosphaerae TaxID=3390502 RepID=UPI00397989E2
MSWLPAVPAALASVFWVVAPGAIVTSACGLRGITRWGAAPLVSVAVIATAAVLGTPLGVPWGPWVPLVAALLVALAALLFRGFVARRPAGSALHRGWRTALTSWRPGREIRSWWVRVRTPSGEFARRPDPLTTALPQVWRSDAARMAPDGRRAGLAASAGLLVGMVVGALTMMHGIGPSDTLSSTYDAVFHYSAVEHVIRSGDASSLTLGRLTSPGAGLALYPAAWHDLVSLVAMSSGSGVIQATNLTAWAVAAVAWPLSVLFLTRQVLGRSATVAFAAPVLASGFTAFPWMLMSFGVLWPNLLGVAILPASLAALVSLVLGAKHSTLGPRGAALLLFATMPAAALAHPNTVFSLAVLGLFPVVWAVARLGRHRLLSRRFWQPLLAAAVVVVVVWTTLYLMIDSPLLSGVRSFDWPAFTDTPDAISNVVWNGMNRRPDLVVLSVLVMVGAVVSFRRATTSWLVPAHLASGFLYVLAASQENDLTAGLTGAWYNDSYRLAAMVPVTGTPLAVLGVLTLAEGLRRLAVLVPKLRRPVAHRAVPAALATALLALAFVFSGAMNLDVHATALSGPYRTTKDQLLEPGQREFLEQVGAQLPDDAVVAENPFTGNGLLFPLTGRTVLFPHLSGNWTPDQRVVAARLRNAAADPAVCDAVRATGTTHVLTGPISFWTSDARAKQYPGLDSLDGAPGFALEAEGGTSKLWRITACGTAGPDGPLPPVASAQVPPPGP